MILMLEEASIIIKNIIPEDLKKSFMNKRREGAEPYDPELPSRALTS